MSFLDELADLMPHLVTVEHRTDVDQYGAPIYGPAVDVKARVVSRQRLVLDASGNSRVSSTQVYLRQSQGVQVRDRLTLPVDMLPRQPVILAVRRSPDDRGEDVEVIYT